jgi:hypothetical protein
MRAFQSTVVAGFTLLALAALTPAASAEVLVSIQNGRVSIVAKDATVRQILTEWARVGRTKIVNVERIPGGPLTLELKDVPETEALEVLLRTLTGYMAAPRVASTPDMSQFGTIIVLPTTAPPPSRTAAAVAPAPFAPPAGFPPVDDDQGPAPGQVQRGPIFTTFPQPQVGTPQQRPNLPAARPGVQTFPEQPQPQVPTVQPPVIFPQPATPNSQPSSPSAPFGAVSTPGMIAPGQQPGQIRVNRPNEN